jgi:uncharacterized protein (DUF1330 family)/uncharacterized protein YjiS (DUF1127 family)
MAERGEDQERSTLAQRSDLRRAIVAAAHAARDRAIRRALTAAVRMIWRGWASIRARHRARSELAAMDDYQLRDIGLARTGIEAAIRRGRPDDGRPALPPSHQPWRHLMSKAYWIVRVSVHDAQRYPAYLAAARPAFEAFGARFVVRGGAFESMEGSARDRNVVVEFADRATAMACYQSPDYQAAKAIRQSCAEADFIIVDGAE